MGCPILCLFGFPNSILIMNIAITALPPLGSTPQAEKLQTSYVLLAEREISSSLFSQQGTEALQVGWPPCGIGLVSQVHLKSPIHLKSPKASYCWYLKTVLSPRQSELVVPTLHPGKGAALGSCWFSAMAP